MDKDKAQILENTADWLEDGGWTAEANDVRWAHGQYQGFNWGCLAALIGCVLIWTLVAGCAAIVAFRFCLIPLAWYCQ